MTKRTRLFLMIAAGVLLVGLGTGLVASYMGLPALALRGDDGPEELQYVPADTKILAFANVRDVMTSELRQKIREARPGRDGEGDEFRARTGIDIEQDVDRVVACLAGSGSETERERFLVLARGRFDTVRIEGLAREHGGEVVEYKGKRLVRHYPEDGHSMAVAFMEPGLVAFGTERAIREAIDLAAGGANVTGNGEIMGLVRDIDDGNAWAVGRFEAIAHRARLPREVANQLPPINWFAASGHVNGGLRGVVRAEARDETAAQNLRDVIRGFMALARLQTNAKPELGAMMQSLQLGGEGRTVSLEFSMPSEVIDMIGALHLHRRADPDPDPDSEHDYPEVPEPPDVPGPPEAPKPPLPPQP